MIITNLVPFLTESLKIENILRPPMQTEIEATQKFLALPQLTVDAVKDLAKLYEARAVLRDKKGMNVQVGRYLPPGGGPGITRKLMAIINRANQRSNPYFTHIEFETLHPFMDGNGRSGRSIWAWQMIQRHGAYDALALLFLHRFYYQVLEFSDERA